MGQFREAVEVVHRMWTETQPVFTGRHYSIDEPIDEPKGVRRPHPSFGLGRKRQRDPLWTPSWVSSMFPASHARPAAGGVVRAVLHRQTRTSRG